VDSQSGNAANLKGTDFEGTLISSSDAKSMCTNRSLEDEGRMNLGC
jgi:hypothetical protein